VQIGLGQPGVDQAVDAQAPAADLRRDHDRPSAPGVPAAAGAGPRHAEVAAVEEREELLGADQRGARRQEGQRLREP
jgi:hypothetical protein